MSQHLDMHVDLCAGYALGSLDQEDRLLLEEHLAGGCPTCERALAEFSSAVTLVAASAPPAMPSPAVRDRVLAAIASEPQADDRGLRVVRGDVDSSAMRTKQVFGIWGWGAVAVAAALAVVSGMTWIGSNRVIDELSATRKQLLEVQQQLETERHWAEVINAPGARVATLEATPQGVAMVRARAMFDPASRRAILVFDNLHPEPGHDYQLWAIRGAAPASLGLITPDASGRAILRLEDAGDPATLAAFAVSFEATGGSPNPNAPTGPVVMLGKLSS